MVILTCKLCGSFITWWWDWEAVKEHRRLFFHIQRLYCNHCARFWAGTEV
jgi:hypothetical protein